MSGAGAAELISAFEAETYCENLQTFDIKSIGNSKWLQQHEWMEKLNVQAHHSVTANTDEFVMDAIILFEKLPVLIHELLAIEVWRENVYPRLVEIDFCEKTSMTAYMVLYHEATVLSLLEAVLYHKEAVEACGDVVMDLADYCHRQVCYLNGMKRYEDGDDAPLTTKQQLEQTGQEQLEDQIKTLPFEIATKGVAIIRYLLDSCQILPLSCLTRMLNTHDIPCALVPLITNSPWMRTKEGNLEKCIDNQWTVTEPADRFKLTKVEAQVWLAMYTLMQDPDCRKKYLFNTYNKNEVLRLRGFFNDVVIDQIPLLNEMRRTLEELSMMEPPAPEHTVVLEIQPEIKEAFLKVNAKKWDKVAAYQKKKVFCPSMEVLQEQAKQLSATYDLDMLESLMPEDPKCAKCGEIATLRCSRCRNEWYCRRQCQVEHWKGHKKMCAIICGDIDTAEQKAKAKADAKAEANGVKADA